ncbi:MAG: hypothetical protein HWN65_20205 [Candidatus Helarchaeota archaeon]|nr:hypothetical protein [Candidatus Helarchaeota archaeon]
MEVNFNRTNSFDFRACGPMDTQLTEDSDYFTKIGPLDEALTSRELNILFLLSIEAYSKDSQAELSFQGIKTKLNLHQQKVATSLKRLLRKKLIDKTLNGYKINKTGMKVINSLLQSPKTSLTIKPKEYVGLEIMVPLNNKNNDLFKLVYLLKGRWFGKWRWIGMFQNSSSVKMEWQSLSSELEACLCINESRICIALFDKNSNPSNPNLELLREEFNTFLLKIQKIMNIDLNAHQSVSTAMIKTHSSCKKSEMSNWLSNYA